MNEFGNTLKAAREAKGLSIAQIAETTMLNSQVLNDLEAGDFARIPAEIYGRGFVKLYCIAVGLDPWPMQEEFTRLYNHEESPAPVPEPAPEPVPEPAMPAPEVPPAIEPEAQASLSRYSAPLREPKRHPMITIPPSIWRLAVLVVLGALVLYGIFSGLKMLHRATATELVEPEAETLPVTETAPEPAATETAPEPVTPSAPRTAQKLPGFYID